MELIPPKKSIFAFDFSCSMANLHQANGNVQRLARTRGPLDSVRVCELFNDVSEKGGIARKFVRQMSVNSSDALKRWQDRDGSSRTSIQESQPELASYLSAPSASSTTAEFAHPSGAGLMWLGTHGVGRM